jgi:hypothetical protein
VVDRVQEQMTPEAPVPAPRASSSEGGVVAAAGATAATADKPPLRERMFGRSSAESADALRETYGVEEAPDQIRAEVTAAERRPDRTFEISLANGQVWRQTEATSFSVKAGDKVRIKAGMMGAYYLRREGDGRTIRVKRVR